ncbi:MAG: argininosuccinate lyase, partial [Parvibaculales bacterium]
LGFTRPAQNSIDAVSSRDFVLEVLAAISILSLTLSRMAEEIVIFSSAQFGFFISGERFSTGSSIMPQKKNPDAAELIRAKTGSAIASWIQLAVVMKGLPLAYCKDMQEDKQPFFTALDDMLMSLEAMAGLMAEMGFDKKKMAKSVEQGYSTATDLADWLVRTQNIPFREAHHITGEIVAWAEKKNLPLADIPLKELQKKCPAITKDIFSVLGAEQSMQSRKSEGGTAPQEVKKQAALWQKKLKG